MYRFAILILFMMVFVSCSENEDKEVHERIDAREAVESKRTEVVKKLAGRCPKFQTPLASPPARLRYLRFEL